MPSRSLRAVQDAGLDLPVSLEAVDFTDEEGTLIGTLGSLALAGGLTPRRCSRAPRGGRDVLVAELARMGLSEDGLLGARRDPATLAGYLELHIEQGPVLERAGVQIGIVTGITGTASFSVVFDGRGPARGDDTDGRPARRGGRGCRLRARGAGRRRCATFPAASPRSATSPRSPARSTSSRAVRRFGWSAGRSTRSELEALARALDAHARGRRQRPTGSE